MTRAHLHLADAAFHGGQVRWWFGDVGGGALRTEMTKRGLTQAMTWTDTKVRNGRIYILKERM